jgi:hypothetical protein
LSFRARPRNLLSFGSSSILSPLFRQIRVSGTPDRTGPATADTWESEDLSAPTGREKKSIPGRILFAGNEHNPRISPHVAGPLPSRKKKSPAQNNREIFPGRGLRLAIHRAPFITKGSALRGFEALYHAHLEWLRCSR